MLAIAQSINQLAEKVTDIMSLTTLYCYADRTIGNLPKVEDVYALTRESETKDCDATAVWDHLEPTGNVFRFLVYIMWLYKQPRAYAKFALLRQERGDEFEKCLAVLKEFKEKRHES